MHVTRSQFHIQFQSIPFFGKTTINKRIYSIRNTRVGSFRWPLWSLHPKSCFHPFIQVHCGAYLTLKMQLKFMSEEYNLVVSMMIFWILMIFHDFCIKMCYFADFSHDNVVLENGTSVYISSVISFESKCHFSILKIGTARTNTKICRTYFPTIRFWTTPLIPIF